MSKNNSNTHGEHFEERKNNVNLLKEAIEAGEKSGYIDNFDPVKHLAQLNEKYSEFPRE